MTNNSRNIYQKMLYRVSSAASMQTTNLTSSALVSSSKNINSSSNNNNNTTKGTKGTTSNFNEVKHYSLDKASPVLSSTRSTRVMSQIKNTVQSGLNLKRNRNTNIITETPTKIMKIKAKPKRKSFSSNLANLKLTSENAFFNNNLNNPVSKSVKTNTVYSGFDFSVLSLENGSLISSATEMLFSVMLPVVQNNSHSTTTETELKTDIIDFITLLKASYTDTTFHNFYHAVDVTQLMFTLITQYFSNNISTENKFFLIVTCLFHDIKHSGANSSFLRNHNILNNKNLGSFNSLEEFHIDESLKIIHSHILFTEKYIKPETKILLEDLITYLIDATDMEKDSEFRKAALSVNLIVQSNTKLPKEYLAILMKISDLANVVRHFDDAESWSAHLSVELLAMKKYDIVHAENSNSNNSTEKNFRNKNLNKDMETITGELLIVQEFVRSKESDKIFENLGNSTTGFVMNIVKPITLFLDKLNPSLTAEYNHRLRSNLELWHNYKKKI